MNPKADDSSSVTTGVPAPSSAWTLKMWLFFVGLISIGGLLPLGAVLWDAHQARQITHVEDLGLARDAQWLGTSGQFWLLHAQTGALLTLESPREGWAMEPNTRLVRKTSAHGKRWVCDASMQHCLLTADKQHTLTGAQL